jgi:hypothetical protein
VTGGTILIIRDGVKETTVLLKMAKMVLTVQMVPMVLTVLMVKTVKMVLMDYQE